MPRRRRARRRPLVDGERQCRKHQDSDACADEADNAEQVVAVSAVISSRATPRPAHRRVGRDAEGLGVERREPVELVVGTAVRGSACPASPPRSLERRPGERDVDDQGGSILRGPIKCGCIRDVNRQRLAGRKIRRSTSSGRSASIRRSAVRSIVHRAPATPRHKGMKPANIKNEKPSKVNAATALARLVAAIACPRSRMAGSAGCGGEFPVRGKQSRGGNRSRPTARRARSR